VVTGRSRFTTHLLTTHHFPIRSFDRVQSSESRLSFAFLLTVAACRRSSKKARFEARFSHGRVDTPGVQT